MEIRVVVTLFGALRGAGKGESITIRLPAEATVSDVLNSCGLPDRVDIWALVDGRKAARDSRLHDGAEIQFFQPVGGG